MGKVPGVNAIMIIWEFRVREEWLEEFEAAYGPDGDWAKLFRRAPGFLGTKLFRSVEGESTKVFLTLDSWQDALHWEAFQRDFAAEYRELDARCAAYTVAERKIGVYAE